MFGLTARAWVVLSACAIFSGCTKAVELRSIETFHTALNAEDLDQLKSASSDRFEQQALRSQVAMEDIKLLKLPKGEVRLIEAKDISKTEKRVVVEIGKSKRPFTYKLVRTSEDKPWVVDDIYIKQRHKGVISRKPVTEQVDLFLTLREFLGDWHAGTVQRVPRTATPEFAKMLKQMPPGMLKQLTAHVIGDRAIEKTHDPQAALAENFANVQLDRKHGRLLIAFKRMNGQWLADDIAFQSRDEEETIGSFRKTALAMVTGEQFLAAYRSANRTDLQRICTKEFYTSGLNTADPKLLPLPVQSFDPRTTRIKAYRNFAELVHSGTDGKTVQIRLAQEFGDGTTARQRLDEADIRDPQAPVKYRVAEVTLHDPRSKQQVRLSTYFVSNAIVQIFAEALEKGDLASLRLSSTPDFNSRVWKQLDRSVFSGLPLAGIEKPLSQVTGSRHKNKVTRVTAMHGNRKVTYVLTVWNGKPLIDDIEVADPKHPLSIKETMDVMLPTQRFLANLRKNDPKALMADSSADFNRAVWSQAEQVPQIGRSTLGALAKPLSSIRRGDDTAEVLLGSNYGGAKISMNKEYGRFVVDNVLLLGGVEPNQQAWLKPILKDRLVLRDGGIAHRDRGAGIGRTPDIRPNPIIRASGSGTGRRNVRSADFQHPLDSLDKKPLKNAIYSRPIEDRNPIRSHKMQPNHEMEISEAPLTFGREKRVHNAMPPLDINLQGRHPTQLKQPERKPHPLEDLRVPAVPKGGGKGNLSFGEFGRR